MLVRLLRSHLDAYRPLLAAVVVLQLGGTLAMLYLPSLNADIIDNGVAKADTGYILRVGLVMLAVTVVAGRVHDRRRLVRRADRDGLRSRRARRPSSIASAPSPPARSTASGHRR